MNQISYTVRCTFENDSTVQNWLTWLAEEHLQEVLDGGASQAVVYQMDGDDLTYEIRYEFPDRNKFEHYEQNFAPELRKKGSEKFPLNLGLRYERTVGAIVDSLGTS